MSQVLVVWELKYTDMTPLAVYESLNLLKKDFPDARDVDFIEIEDDCPKFVYQYVEFYRNSSL